jgi:uncharacterized protein YaeQ
VYAHRDPTQAIRAWAGERIHRVEALEVYRFDRPMLDELVARLDRRTTFALAVHDRELFIAIDDASIEGRVSRVQVT